MMLDTLLPRGLNALGNLAYALGLRRPAWWCYDTITNRGWEGVNTFITLELYGNPSRVDAQDIR